MSTRNPLSARRTLSTRKTFIAILAVALVAAALAPAAEACVKPVKPVAWIIPVETCCPWDGGPCYTRFKVKIHGFFTFGATRGQFCGCALSVGGPIIGVNGATVTNSATGERIAGFSFNSNAATTQSASELLGGQVAASLSGSGDFATTSAAAGFSADVSRDIPSGTDVDVTFDVLLDGSGDAQQLADYLVSEGIVVTGEVDEEGSFGGEHVEVSKVEDAAIGESAGSTEPITATRITNF